MKCPECGRDFVGGIRYGMIIHDTRSLFALFRGVKTHRNARSSVCKNLEALEAQLREKMVTEPEQPHVVMRLLNILQTDAPPRGRITEALNICLRRRGDWRYSADWQTAVLELCQNYQVRNYFF